MNIVFVIDTYNESGGGSIATKRLVDELKKRGHNIKIIAAIHEDPKDPNFFAVPSFVMPVGGSIQKNMKFYFGKNKKNVFKAAMQGADIVQIQYPFLMAKGASKMAKKLDIPIIGTFHVQPQNILLAINKKNKIYEKIIWRLFKYFLFDRVDQIVTPSNFAKQLLLANGINGNITSISNGITKEYTKQEVERPNWFKNHFVIISVGRHALEKRHSLIIEAIKKSKYAEDIQLILAGKGELTEELKELGKSLPIKPFIKYISNEDKIRYLNTANLYIHSSIIELESLATAEAIGCGLPCLISNASNSAASQFALNKELLFIADDVQDLATKINYCYENKIKLKSIEMQRQALDMAKKYNIDLSVDRYETLYKKITKHK
jgi:1,2-diacylglycerol 3-alpha-glucosyltransferase